MFGPSDARRCTLFMVLVLQFATATVVAQQGSAAPAKPPETGKVAGTPVAGADNSSPAPLAVRDQSRYVLSPGDVLEVSVYGVPDLTQKTRIGSTGDINLPLVNTIHIGGMHIEDAQARIEQALRNGNYLTNPHVTLLVTEYGSGVELMGEVARPGIYPVLGSRRLFDILSAAGGTTPSAGKEVTIANRANHTQRLVLLSNDPQKAMDADVLVYQGETVFVSRAGVIYVVGEVLQPSGFMMENKTEYTALRAIAMAHGTTKFAKLSQARIVRRDGDGVTDILVPLDKIVQSKAPDVKLLPEDILYVPTNKGKVVAVQAAQVAISLATSVAIFSIPHN
jgi:polysaccharide export outer membrane protein